MKAKWPNVLVAGVLMLSGLTTPAPSPSIKAGVASKKRSFRVMSSTSKSVLSARSFFSFFIIFFASSLSLLLPSLSFSSSLWL